MSVTYYLNKGIRLGDLKKNGFKIEDHRNEERSYPFVVENSDGSGVAITYTVAGEPNEDDWVINEFEGRFSHGGACAILEMCDKFGCKFITDEDIDNAFYTEKPITEEDYTNRTEAFRKKMSSPD